MKQINRGVLPVSVADEVVFTRLFLMERRRCERAGTRFALMLFNIEELHRALGARVTEKIASAIGGSVRETDITGWYAYPAILGVIFTVLNGTGKHSLESLVVDRIGRVLSFHLDALQIQSIRVSLYVFPDDDDLNNSGRPGHTFYRANEKDNFKSRYRAAMKRAIDVAGTFTALLVLSPLFLTVSVLIKMTSPGPVFFKQKRLGQFGKEFTFLKFRSMYVDSDATIHKEYIGNLIDRKVVSTGIYKIQKDPRVTPLGRFLRKSSLDELPQFINVLKGEMSLVGPRPAIRYEVERYSAWHCRRVEGKPGITGEWQVNGRSRTTFDEMVRMDLRYIRNQSIWIDLKILLKTPFAVLSGNGAY